MHFSKKSICPHILHLDNISNIFPTILRQVLDKIILSRKYHLSLLNILTWATIFCSTLYWIYNNSRDLGLQLELEFGQKIIDSSCKSLMSLLKRKQGLSLLSLFVWATLRVLDATMTKQFLSYIEERPTTTMVAPAPYTILTTDNYFQCCVGCEPGPTAPWPHQQVVLVDWWYRGIL